MGKIREREREREVWAKWGNKMQRGKCWQSKREKREALAKLENERERYWQNKREKDTYIYIYIYIYILGKWAKKKREKIMEVCGSQELSVWFFFFFKFLCNCNLLSLDWHRWLRWHKVLGYPSKYWPGSSLLSYDDRAGTDAVIMTWQ